MYPHHSWISAKSVKIRFFSAAKLLVWILLDRSEHLVEDPSEHEGEGDRVEVGEEHAEGLPGVQAEPEPEGRRTDQHIEDLPASAKERGNM